MAAILVTGTFENAKMSAIVANRTFIQAERRLTGTRPEVRPKKEDIKIMLQDAFVIRNYQKITDELVNMWERGYRTDELRLFLDGYLAALRATSAMEPHLIHRLEDEVTRFLYDYSNFSDPYQSLAQPELER